MVTGLPFATLPRSGSSTYTVTCTPRSASVTAAATTHSVNSSREPVRVTCHSNHGNTRRPPTSINATNAATSSSVKPAADERARRVVSAIGTTVTVAVAAFTVVVWLAAPLIVPWVTPGFDATLLTETVDLTRVMGEHMAWPTADIARYNANGDTGRIDQMVALFAPNARMEVKQGWYEGREGIRSIFTGAEAALLADRYAGAGGGGGTPAGPESSQMHMQPTLADEIKGSFASIEATTNSGKS